VLPAPAASDAARRREGLREWECAETAVDARAERGAVWPSGEVREARVWAVSARERWPRWLQAAHWILMAACALSPVPMRVVSLVVTWYGMTGARSTCRAR